MCQFVSWIESEEEVFYLTKDDLKGKKFHEYKKYNFLWRADIMGHGAIGFFYPEIRGVHKECSDFSNPENFPEQIVKDIKVGKFEGIGVCKEILNPLGLKKYGKIQQAAGADYKKIEQLAKADYEKIQQPAWADYEKIRQAALADYEKIQQAALADYKKIEQPAWADYEKIEQLAEADYIKIQQAAWADYEKIQQAAWADYKKIEQPAWADYEKIRQAVFWKIAGQKKYRKNIWK